MQRAIRLFKLVFLACVVVATLTDIDSANDRAHAVATKASKAGTHTCEDVTEFETCHDSCLLARVGMGNSSSDCALCLHRRAVCDPASTEGWTALDTMEDQ